ncbi:MAG: hypothetical protein EB020_04020 [Proteobacteria bacterium]|nr:hypothetical protein [Pseudomonadota bacterium]
MFGDVIPIEDELLAALYNGGNEEREMILETVKEEWFVTGSGKILYAKAVADLEAGREPSIAASYSIPDKEVKDRLATLGAKLSPSVFSLRTSVKAAAERAQKMQVVFACNVAEEEIKSGEPPLEVAARLEGKLRDLGCEGDDEIKTIGDAASGLLSDMERAAKRKTLFSGISSGISGLDVLTGGFRNGQMIVVAARTGEGKTALASQLLLHAARNKWDEDRQDWASKGYVTCLVELEMTSSEVAQRCVAHLGGPQMWKMRDAGKLTEKDLADARAAMTTLQNLPFFVDAPPRMRLGALRAKARGWKRRLGMEMLCVDLIGKVSSDGRERDRWREVAASLNHIGERCRDRGFVFGYHNHDFELAPISDAPDRTGLDVLLGETDPSLVVFEPDVYWIAKGGADPVAILRQYAGRIPIIHCKDMTHDDRRTYAPVGAGRLDWPSILDAADAGGVEWHCVEQDAGDAPMIDCVRTSITNLRSWGMGEKDR